MLLFMLLRDNLRSWLVRVGGSSMLRELSEVPCTLPDDACFHQTFWEGIAQAVKKKIWQALKFSLTFLSRYVKGGKTR